VALVKEGDAGRVAAAVAAEFKRRTSRQATVLVP
jgi:hypothetical protein